jgi:hypothetical protein
MTLETFLDLLETTNDAGWFVSKEGYLRIFVADGFSSKGEQQYDWPVSAVARLAGRDYQIMEWRKAGAFLGLSQKDLDALKGADQNRPDYAVLRLELEKRLRISETFDVLDRIEEQDAKIDAVQEDLLAPWQREKGKQEQEWTDWLTQKE